MNDSSSDPFVIVEHLLGWTSFHVRHENSRCLPAFNRFAGLTGFSDITVTLSLTKNGESSWMSYQSGHSGCNHVSTKFMGQKEIETLICLLEH